ncbi:Nebulin-related-anchoring protein [Acipenser ruthenus]|uniref:Nebulin-related-anchoring protein n=1 Tax=Acipenser ruthenus TaxID=7906 RepID=A0A444ULF5_ACIRT|nr:Nebulin-related-anchoring protein [Acipenser ruthenus]
MTLDNMSLLAAKASRDLASDIKYREAYEKMKDKAVGASVSDSKTLHSLQAAKMSSEIAYRKGSKETQSQFHLPLDMLHLSHAKKAQSLASETEYRKRLHEYTVLPDDMKVKWAKKAYSLQSESQYKADLSWMKGAGWVTEGSLDVQQAKKAGALVSEKKYRQKVDELKFTQVADTLNIKHAKKSQEMQSERLFKEQGESVKHHYTVTNNLPEHLQAKLIAMNLSEARYKQSWTKLRDAGYKLGLDAIPFQAAKASGEMISDYKYKEAFEKTKGRMVGLRGLEDDINISHSVHAGKLQSDLKYRKDSEKTRSQFHLPMDMMVLVHAKKAQSLASDQDYKYMLHQYTSLPDDLKMQWAKKAYELQSEKLYRSDLNFLRGVAWISTGAVQIEGSKRATELLSEKKYRQQPYSFKHTTVTDSPDLLHAKLSNIISNERLYKEAGEHARHHHTPTLGQPEHNQAKINAANFSESKYRQSWHDLRAQGYKLTMDAIPFQAAKASGDIASDYQYKHNFVLEKGKHIGARSILDDPKLLHCMQMAKLQSEQQYKKESRDTSSQFHLAMDMFSLVHAKKAQALASNQDYKTKVHAYTVLPDDMKVQWAKKAYKLQSEARYKQSWTKLRDAGYKLGLDAIPFQAAKASGEMISDYKYKEAFEKTKGRMVGLRGLEDDINISHSVHAGKLQSDLKYRKDSEKTRSQFHLPMDMMVLVHAKKAQSLASDQDYKYMLHQYTSLPDDLKMQWAKKAYELQSEKLYRSDLNFLRGVAWISTGAVQIEGSKRATELLSEKKYRQQPYSFKHTTVTDSPDLLHAKLSNIISNERLYKEAGEHARHHHTPTLGQPEHNQAKINAANFSESKYRQSWHDLRAQGYKLTMDAIPFQAAKASGDIASDYQYKHNFVLEKGKHIGARSILDDPKLLHCMQMAKLQSEQQYKKESRDTSSQFHLAMDMFSLVHAKKAQALASNQDYKTKVHAYTVLPDDMKVQWAKKAYKLQSEKLYKSDLNVMKGVGWITAGTPQIETAKRAGELISERLYKSGDSESMHRCTLPPDHPDFIRARLNAQHISDKAYKTSCDQIRSARFDFRLDAIPFQTAKASREIASDFRYKEAFVKDKGQQIGFRCVDDDPKMKHFLSVSKLQSNNEYKKHSEETRSQYKSHSDQPGFLQAKKSQEQASDLSYRQHLHQYTCDPEQLNLKHAKQAYKLQSDASVFTAQSS